MNPTSRLKTRATTLCMSFAFAAAVSLAGCASVTPVAYTPSPDHVRDPGKQARLLITANVSPGCIADPQINELMLRVEYVCRGAIGNTVMRFDQVDSISIQQSGEWYRVLVRHHKGVADFAWTSKSLEDIEHLADALSALAKSPAKSASGKPEHSI